MLCNVRLRKDGTDFGCGKDVLDRLCYLWTDSISFYECHRVFTLALRIMSVLSDTFLVRLSHFKSSCGRAAGLNVPYIWSFGAFKLGHSLLWHGV